MKIISLRFVFLIFWVLLSVLICIALPSFADTRNAPIIFARVINHNDVYITSFTAGVPGANTVYAAKNLSKAIDPDTLYITPNGEWLFEIASITTRPTFRLTYYTRLGKPFPTNPINALWWSLSADSQYMFYAGVDATGYYETFNLLRLATDAHIELIVAPLVTPVMPNQAPGTPLSKYMLPMDGWSLINKHLLFTNFRDYPGFVGDVIGLSSIDLSSIDFSKSGSYPLPPITSIPTVARLTGWGVLSPDGKSIAYVFLPDTLQANSAFDHTPNSLAIYNLITGNTVIFTTKAHESAYYLKWSSDSDSLTYFTSLESKGISDYNVYEYDVARHIRAMLASELPTIPVICGNQFFEVLQDAHQNMDTLYSFASNAQDKKVALFSADSIELLSCAPSYEWDAAKVATCNPFCTPTPLVPVDTADVAKLDLSGGDSANGEQLYSSLGCGSCHLNGAVGPVTAGTYTRVVTTRLKDPINAGLTAAQYIAESIIQPDAYIVPSYPPSMPSNYKYRLSISQLRDLVAFLMSQR